MDKKIGFLFLWPFFKNFFIYTSEWLDKKIIVWFKKKKKKIFLTDIYFKYFNKLWIYVF